MEQNGPSRTAIGTAVHRAAHLLLDEDPKILVDPFARAFAGYASDAEMLQAIASEEMIEFPRMRAVFALRSRYAEDELDSAITRGIDQYVILGAGLDSFAYRRPDLVAFLNVFGEPGLETGTTRGTWHRGTRASASHFDRLRAANAWRGSRG